MVFRGRYLEVENCDSVCMEAVSDLYPLLLRALLNGGSAVLPECVIPCTLKGCGAQFRLITAPHSDPENHLPVLGTFLSKLPERETDWLLGAGSREQLAAGTQLIEVGVVGNKLYVVMEGQVEVYLPGSNGDDTVLAILGAGECVGEISLLTGQTSSAAVRTRTDCEFVVVDRPSFDALLERSRVLTRVFTQILCERFRRSNREMGAEKLAGYKGRLCTLPIADLLQGLHQTRGSGLLRVVRDQRLAAVSFESGQPVAALILELNGIPRSERFNTDPNFLTRVHEGEEAFFELFQWRDGEFRMEESSLLLEGALEQDLMSLLMEGARRLDESHTR